MRIMMVNPFYYPNEIGGTERVVQQLCEGMVKRGHSVAVLTLDGQSKDILPETINGVSVYRCTGGIYSVGNRGVLQRVLNSAIQLHNTSFNEEIENVIEKFKPDVAHIHNIFGFSPTIWKQIKKHNIPIVHTLHDYWLLGAIQKTVAVAYVKYIDYLTAPSQFVLNKAISTGLFHNISTECIPNGIYYDKETAYALNDKALKRINQENKITFIYAGQLEEIKGIKQLIEAFKLLDQEAVKLLICGDGRLKNYVENNQQQNIKYLGKLRYDELKTVYMHGTVLCVPSVWEEPFGMVALEAFYFSLPIIAGNCGGLREIVETLHSGLLVDGKSPEKINKALKQMSKREVVQQYCNSMRNSEFVYKIERQIESFLKCYASLV